MCLDVTPAEQSAPEIQWEREDQIILEALSILQKRVFSPHSPICSPNDLKQYMRLRLTNQKRVMFGVVFMHADHRPIDFEIMFYGSLTETRIYATQIIERVLHHNAAAVVLVHNKPSGNDIPSDSDKAVTRRLKEALGLFDVAVIDHFIVGNDAPFSFAEHGLI